MQVGTLPERIYGLAIADGRRTVRPFESIRLCFRLFNAQAAATPAAHAIVSIPPGWTALDPVEFDLPVLAAGEEYVHALAVRAEGAGDASVGAFQVALVLPEGTLGSNVVRVAVRGRPDFGGVRSSLRLERGDEPDAIRAVVALVNEGDATARDVRVEVPPPPGFAVAAGGCTYAAGDVAPGDAVACSLAFRAIAPSAAAVRIDDACVVFTGGRDPLTLAGDLVLAPLLLPPAVTMERVATRLEIAVRLANAGALPVVDAGVRIVLPPGWQLVRRAVTLGGAPAATVLRAQELSVNVPLLAACSTVALHLTATARTPRTGGTLRVAWAEHDVAAVIPSASRRSVRLVVRAESAWIPAAASIAVEAVLWNDGETDESITLHASGTCLAQRDVRAGRALAATFSVPVPADARVADDLSLAIVALAGDGERLATATLAARVTGETPAAANVDAPTAAMPATPVETLWELTAAAIPGKAVDVLLFCRFAAEVTGATIRPTIASARYVTGSTRVNGHVVVDGPAGPPLFAVEGLPLHGIPAGSEIAIAWSAIADGSGDVHVSATVDADGTTHSSTAPPVAVAAQPPFVQRPDDLPFYIGHPTLWQPPIAAPNVGPPAVPAIRFGVRLDATRRATIVRMLCGTRGGIVAHLPLLAALFPDTVDAHDARLADALAHAGENVRSVYERLFVKLRIPGYDVGPYDLEDTPTRAALVALLDGAASIVPVPLEPFADLTLTLEPAALRDARARLAEAPLGGVDAVAAVALLLPRTGADPAARALGAYATLLARELDAARSLSHDAFGSYLTMHAVDALEDAREDAIAALAPAPESGVA